MKSFSRIALPIIGFAAWSAAQASSAISPTYAPQNSTIFQLSADPEFAFLFEATLSLAENEGSNTGEVLRVATKVISGNISSYYPAYYNFAEKIHAIAEGIDPAVDPAGAREAYFHASTYYRDSVYLLVNNASDPRLYSVWDQQLADFAKAISFLPVPGERVILKAPNSSIGPFDIPTYYYKGSDCDDRLPTVIVGTGYDGPQEELYHLPCANILKRSINCLTYEGPGQPTPRRAGHAFITDWNSVVTPIVDYLHTRKDVDTTRIVLLGDSFGGLLAPLAAAKEHRLSAMFLLDGLPNFRQAVAAQFPPQLTGLYNDSKVDEFNQAILQNLNNPEFGTGFFYIWAYTFWGLKNPEPYSAWKRLGDFVWNETTAAEIGNLPVYVAKGRVRRQHDSFRAGAGEENLTYHEFLTSLGAGEHTSIGAEAQIYASFFAWLSEIWGGYKFGNSR
ncbi:hypothetical protein M409DRAFT_66103 [Zasmidium cellare ATCC 36951]|uniref:AB hydrolase-1 domain-containing protein n=1 Tax=Zasmidium cellare ATCC 36951 TaxID=1080233 RepID=A0A6A6CNA8_ZASCE|nr:uncharacterized protein M409DRAFT_66103 [Zasmidium cellare ATCC 36951]KAF2167620.1 hypothetical protein M409DRAFT_66103 [Zasmidium cellare ATCC 36951]